MRIKLIIGSIGSGMTITAVREMINIMEDKHGVKR